METAASGMADVGTLDLMGHVARRHVVCEPSHAEMAPRSAGGVIVPSYWARELGRLIGPCCDSSQIGL
jgi:hypothetical protein